MGGKKKAVQGQKWGSGDRLRTYYSCSGKKKGGGTRVIARRVLKGPDSGLTFKVQLPEFANGLPARHE